MKIKMYCHYINYKDLQHVRSLYGDFVDTGHGDKLSLSVHSLHQVQVLVVPLNISMAVSLLRGSRQESVILWLLYNK